MNVIRRTLQGIAIATIIVVFVALAGRLVAPSVSAQTADEIQVQIKELVAKIAELTKQLKILQGEPVPPEAKPDPGPGMGYPHRICGILNRNLTQGTKGDDVVGLQEFLSAEGYLSANATGYFGPMTAQAVAKWQAQEGVAAVGSFGPMSRERVKVWCGDKARFGAEPKRGPAPLTVTFKAMVGGFTPYTYSIDFGDGSAEQNVRCSENPNIPDVCGRPAVAEHTYRSDGIYTAVLYQNHPAGCGPNADPICLGPPAQKLALAKEQIHVGPVACTKEYKPVCGSKPIVCITTPCNPIEQTYGNRCMMNADGASFLYEGQCRIDWTNNPADDPRCKAWYDGCNTCSRNTPDESATCTLRECGLKSMTKPYCTDYFDTANRPPVISSFSGQTTLAVNQSGTWTVNASDPENGNLTYSITWGDENFTPPPMASSAIREAFVQTTTFTHAYSSTGTFTVTIVVRDAAGKEAKTSSTVRVGATFCQPVPPAPCPAGMSIQWHYDSNGCKVSSSCVQQPVACTMDAMLCPNGQYVGRTGPNCQFVCSSGTISAVCPSRIEDAKKKLTCPYGPIEYYTYGDGCSIPKCGTPQPGVIY